MKIKFRAYIKPLKRYAKDYESILYHHQCNMEPTWTVNVSPEEVYGDEDLIIEQSTGLYDKDGKEIFTGDIVEMPDWFLASRLKIVVHSHLTNGYEPFVHGKPGYGLIKGEDVKVVGTLNENPEMVFTKVTIDGVEEFLF